MIESADRHVKILEDLDFHDICLSFKSSSVPLTIAVYHGEAGPKTTSSKNKDCQYVGWQRGI